MKCPLDESMDVSEETPRAKSCGRGFYVTLAGLIPVPLPLAARFWISCIWQILSFSSWVVSSAAAYNASPLLRPFTSTALMAATSLAPHTLKSHSDTHVNNLLGKA